MSCDDPILPNPLGQWYQSDATRADPRHGMVPRVDPCATPTVLVEYACTTHVLVNDRLFRFFREAFTPVGVMPRYWAQVHPGVADGGDVLGEADT